MSAEKEEREGAVYDGLRHIIPPGETITTDHRCLFFSVPSKALKT